MTIRKIIALIFCALNFALSVWAEVPCDFKGLAIGDIKSASEIMGVLGVKDFRINPKKPTFDEKRTLVDEYGLLGAEYIIDERIGPYCSEDSCRIPAGFITVGVNIPTKVFIKFSKDKNQIQAIDVFINSIHWNDLTPILFNKFGNQWNTEKSAMDIVGLKNKRRISVERININHKIGGKNLKTNDLCEINATNYNTIFEQSDSLGLYQGVFELKIISKNF